MTGFHTEILRIRGRINMVRTECLNCEWFAAGSEQAIDIAERAHQECRHRRSAPETARMPANKNA